MTVRMLRRGFLFAITLLLAGCAGLGNAPPRGGDNEERQVIELIGYARGIAAMTAEQQRREYSANSQAFAKDGGAISRMQLALLLATPGASVHDPARAASLLEPLASPDAAASPLHSLAGLLYALLHERAAEHKRASRMREQLDGRKDIEHTLREQLAARKEVERSLREQLEARKESERTLREQLEALKEVERTILQRGQESQPRRR